MILRHSLIYFAFRLIPAAASLLGITFYTRFLQPAEYGLYSFTLLVASGFSALFFNWISISLNRFIPEAQSRIERITILTSAFMAFSVPAFLLIIATLIYGFVFNSYVCSGVLVIFALPVAVCTGWFELNQRIHNSNFEPITYGLALSLKSFISISCGAFGVYFLNWKSSGILGVLIFSYLAPTVFSLKNIRLTKISTFDYRKTISFLRYGLPLTLTLFMVFILNGSSRFFLNKYLGLAAVGSFSASYDLVQYSIGMLISVVSLSGFPAIIKAYSANETQGNEKAVEYFTILLILVIPATLGIISIKNELSNIFIGVNFRSDSVKLIPLFATAVLLNILKSAYFDYSFQLAKKTTYQVIISATTAVTSILLNMVMIREFGILGAAYSCIISYSIYLFLTMAYGAKVFKMPIPSLATILKIIFSGAIMYFSLESMHHPSYELNLLIKIFFGFTIYSLSIMCFKVVNIHSILKK